jgi:leucine dehydrogenase
VIGLGHVGQALAARLREAGAALVASDIDPDKRRIAEQLGAAWVEPGDAVTAECEILAPCALGGAINAETIDRLRCEIVCGSANNVLADDSLAGELHERGILYAPDFIANAGGLINVYGELHELELGQLDELVDGIGDALGRVFDLAAERSITPLGAAREVARERLRSTGPVSQPTAVAVPAG